MSFFYHELKNHINRDPLSDWFEITNKKYNSFKKDTKTSFQLDLESKKAQYKIYKTQEDNSNIKHYCTIHTKMHNLYPPLGEIKVKYNNTSAVNKKITI